LAGYTLYQLKDIQFQDFALARVENAVKPLATTDAATSVRVDRAELNGTIKAYDHDATVTFEYGTDTSYGTIASAAPAVVTGTARTSVTYLLTGLKSNTTYHYRVVAASSVGTTYGSDQTFTTPTIPFTYLPVVLK
jgi:phosphodiesterase/alkaline phosphatase D-like protein